MSFLVLRLCPRSLFSVPKTLISCQHSKYPSVLQQQRFCSALNDAKLGNDVDTFEEFEENPAFHELFTSVDIDDIAGDDLDQKKSLQVLISELNMQIQTQRLVAPKCLTAAQWRKLLKFKSDKSRSSYLNKLYFLENKKESKATRSKERQEDLQKHREWKESNPREAVTTNSPISYGLHETSLFHRLYKQTMKQKYNFDLVMAMYFGPDLVVDCSYEKYMKPSEIYGCARQMLYMWSSNRADKNPFNLIFCNLNPEGKIIQHLTKLFHQTENDFSVLNLTEKSYTDLYPTKELVYLTPHCDEELEKYDGDSIYIIGAYVDEIVNKPVSLAKAQRDGLRTAKFPLDKNLNWAQGSKLLPINQCLCIMNDLKNGANWDYALRHVATRKQSFQFLGGHNSLRINDRMAKHSIREQARRDMLRDLNIKEIFKKKNKDSIENEDIL